MVPDASKQTSAQLSEQYDEQSEAYLRYWAPILHPISATFVASLPACSPGRVIDVGAGNGLLLPVLRDKYPGAAVFGLDRSEGMISRADETDAVLIGDAIALGLRSGTFDVVLMSFMLFHVPDPVLGLCEARRILRPDGVVGVSTWADDMTAPPVEIWNEELEAQGAPLAEDLGRLAHHDRMDTIEKTSGLLEAAGFTSVRAEMRQVTHEIPLDDFIGIRTSIGSTKQRFDSLARHAREQCVANARRRLQALQQQDFMFRMNVIVTVGRQAA